MSRKGMLLYFSYVALLVHAPMYAQEMPVDFSDGDQVQFAFDIHDTLTETKNLEGLWSIGVTGAIGLVWFGMLSKYYPATDGAVAQDGSAEAIIAVHDKIRASDLASQSAMNFADARHIISPEMIALQKNLSKKYDIKVLSNIGPRNWAKIQARYPELFNEQIINGGIITDYAIGQKIKPHDEPYERFEREYRQINPTTGKPKLIIFVDDKQRNVDAANKRSGWIGILFKNLAQFKKDIAKFGINFEQEDSAESVNA